MPTHQSNKVKDPNSLKQELINIIIRSMALKPLEGDAKDHCQKGHEMKGVYSQQMMSNKNFPWGTVKQISKMGLVQKDGLEYVKVSVDRLTFTCVSIGGVNKIMLIEYKS